MSRIAVAWELGTGMGHVRYLSELAVRLREAGHEVSCIMRNVVSADRELDSHGIRVLQAPILPKPSLKAELTVNFAEILIIQGFLVQGSVKSVIRSWRHLFDLLEPDLLIVNYAPSALIAARNYPVRVTHLGTGFAVPPRLSPMPSLPPDIEVDDERLHNSEEMVVRSINTALGELGERQISHLHEILECDQEVLTTFAELDHYPTRRDACYWGPILNSARAALPEWPGKSGRKKKIFCYLKRKHPMYGDIVGALGSISASKLIFAGGDPQSRDQESSSDDLVYSPDPLDLEAVCEDSDLVICHAGHGTVSTALLKGTPLLLVPEVRQLEQAINAHNVKRLGAGTSVQPGKAAQDRVRAAIEEVIEDKQFTIAAQNFAKEHIGFDPVAQVEDITDLCARLAAG